MQQGTRVEESLYEVLGIAVIATFDEVKAAYRRLAFQVHPDRNPRDPLAAARFIRVQQAYETLIDPIRRRAYDNGLPSLDESAAYWVPDVQVSFTFNYYGYWVSLEVLKRAEEQAERFATQAGISEAEAISRLVLDPLISRSLESLQRNPRDLATLVTLADLYFHTYRSYKALEYYVQALRVSLRWQTAVACEHLERAFHYAGDWWGGSRMFITFLAQFPSAPEDVRKQWATDAVRLLSDAEARAIKDLAPDRKYEMMKSFLAKKTELGYHPSYEDRKKIADVAVAAGDLSAAQQYLIGVELRSLGPHQVSAMMRSQLRAGLTAHAIDLGERILTPERLKATLNEYEQRVCKALAEAYEQAERLTDALALYKKLARYGSAGAALKGKAHRLEQMVRAQGETPHRSQMAGPA